MVEAPEGTFHVGGKKTNEMKYEPSLQHLTSSLNLRSSPFFQNPCTIFT